MKTVQLKNFPVDVHQKMKVVASLRGISIREAYVIAATKYGDRALKAAHKAGVKKGGDGHGKNREG